MSTCVAVKKCPLHGLSPQSLPTRSYGKHKEYTVVCTVHPTYHAVAGLGDGKTAFQRCGRTLHHGTVGHKATTVSSSPQGQSSWMANPRGTPRWNRIN